MPAQQMEMTSQAEEYLEAICRIIERGETATPTELARELAVAPPSVLGMLRRLEEQGILTYARQTGAVLTENGMERAARLRRRHRLAERLLTDLIGMPWARAHDVACRFEHVIDDELENYLSSALHHPTTCPHGNPIPGATPDGPAQRRLAEAQPGDHVRLVRITESVEHEAESLTYLGDHGLTPGTTVVVQSRAPDGTLTLILGDSAIALGPAMTERMFVAAL